VYVVISEGRSIRMLNRRVKVLQEVKILQFI